MGDIYGKSVYDELVKNSELYKDLLEENKKLKEFKAKQEEMMFLIGASIELAEPKTYKDAEKLQKGKEIYEKLYKKELYSLRKENELLKECNIRNYTSKSNTDDMNLKLLEENKKLEEKYEKLKADYIKLSKIVEVSGGYKASYVNELRDKIAKLEFDIEARIKLKAVREDKERILNKEIMGLRDQKYNHGEPVVSSGPCFVGGNIS